MAGAVKRLCLVGGVWLSLAGCHDFDVAFDDCRRAGGCGATDDGGVSVGGGSGGNNAVGGGSGVGGGGGTGQAVLAASDSGIDFGDVARGVQATGAGVVITNIGDATTPPLSRSLQGLNASEFSIISGCQGVGLVADAGCSIVLGFASNFEGPRSAELLVQAPSLPDLTVALRARSVGGVLAVAIDPVDLGLAVAGTTNSAGLTITNRGLTTSQPVSIAVGPAPIFSQGAGCDGQLLGVNASCQLTVMFSPPDAGRWYGNLHASAGASSLDAGLVGTGYFPSTFSVSPMGQSFGYTAVGGARSAAFTVTNSVGTLATPPVTLELSADSGSFFLDGGACAGSALDAGASCVFWVDFRPVSSGLAQALVRVTAGTLDAGAVSLDGTGFEAIHVTLRPDAGPGSGALDASVPGLGSFACPGTGCEFDGLKGGTLGVGALPAAGALLTSWGGDCAGHDTSTPCTLALTNDAGYLVTASFAPRVLLTVKVSGPGVVLSEPPGVACPPTCAVDFGLGAQVRLRPTDRLSDHVFGTFDGFVGCNDAGLRHCDVILSTPRFVDAGYTRANVAFVTSTVYSVTSGLSTYDSACALGGSVLGAVGPDGGPGRFVALISSSSQSAAARVGSASGWVRPDGRIVVIGSPWDGGGPLVHALSMTENNASAAFGAVLTGTLATGAGTSNCSGWTLGTGSHEIGSSSRVNKQWIEYSSQPCGGAGGGRVYCVQTDFSRTLALPPPPPGARIAFLGRTNLTGDFASTVDTVCTNEARDAGWGGSFAGLRATKDAGAVSRVRLDAGNWYRPDGVQLTLRASDLAGGQLLAPVSVHASGEPARDDGGFNPAVWTGSTSPGSGSGVPNGPCDDWSRRDAGFGITGTWIDVGQWFNSTTNTAACSVALPVYCFEN